MPFELNDPLDQEQRFIEMGRLMRIATKSTPWMMTINALSYGMPPQVVLGGVDRLVMLFRGRRIFER